jgi:hypothetical protein
MSSESMLSSTMCAHFITKHDIKADKQDAPADADSYLHRVGRAGRFGTKGLGMSPFTHDGNDLTSSNLFRFI